MVFIQDGWYQTMRKLPVYVASMSVCQYYTVSCTLAIRFIELLHHHQTISILNSEKYKSNCHPNDRQDQVSSENSRCGIKKVCKRVPLLYTYLLYGNLGLGLYVILLAYLRYIMHNLTL